MTTGGQRGMERRDRSAAPFLVGRERECERLAQLVREARAGGAGRLWFVGPPGSGKTALCGWVARAADQFQTVTVGCVEDEASLAFGAAVSVVRPLRTYLAALPAASRHALEALLERSRSDPDPFASGAAILALLAEAAEHSPLLLIIDDAHWIDPASGTALRFALRRLDRDAVLTVLASRHRSVRLGFDPTDEHLELGGLEADAAMAVLGRSGPIAPHVAVEVIAATGGLPLALVEVGAQLSVAQRLGEVPLPEPLPVGDRLLAAYQERIRSLPAATRLALGVVAAAGSATHLVVPSLAAFDLTLEDLLATEAEGVVLLEPEGPRFGHPLMRTAALGVLGPGERRRIYASLATLAADVEDRARYLVRSSPGPSEAISAELESMASTLSEDRGAPAASGVWLDAARLSPPGENRLRRLQRAADELATVGRVNEAETCLTEVRATTSDPLARAEAAIASAWIRQFSPEATTVAEEATVEADRIADISGQHALLLRCLAAVRELNCGGASWDQFEFPSVPDDGIASSPLTFETTFPAYALAAQNRVDEARAWFPVERIRRFLDSYPPEGGMGQVAGLQTAALSLMWMERFAEAEQLTVSVIRHQRRAKRPLILGGILGVLGEIQLRTGRWAEAEASLTEGQTLASQTGQAMLAAICGGLLTRLAGGRGTANYEQRADAILSSSSTREMFSARLYARHGFGVGHLSVGRYAEAAHTLDRLARDIQPVLRSPTAIPYQADRVEALLRTGERARAKEAWLGFRASAAASRSAWAGGTSLRLEAMLSDQDTRVDPVFEQSTAMLETYPFERARTQLCWAESLRRRRDLRHSRRLLSSAAETFDELQAVAWSDRARVELRATGDRSAQADRPAVAALTPQELQVALTVGEGGSNREVAASLFISPKTVEHHLSRIYMKLGLRSRSELVRLVMRELAQPHSTSSASLGVRQ